MVLWFQVGKEERKVSRFTTFSNTHSLLKRKLGVAIGRERERECEQVLGCFSREREREEGGRKERENTWKTSTSFLLQMVYLNGKSSCFPFSHIFSISPFPSSVSPSALFLLSHSYILFQFFRVETIDLNWHKFLYLITLSKFLYLITLGTNFYT